MDEFSLFSDFPFYWSLSLPIATICQYFHMKTIVMRAELSHTHNEKTKPKTIDAYYFPVYNLTKRQDQGTVHFLFLPSIDKKLYYVFTF